ncbi:hypothetical protein GBAR_LOCUS1774 [Geodia barretti]|nr:hypothetical protein GBAR_LOCUS1774 [Geodia barretti]
MDHYIPLILRSHLEKPVKYIIPNQLQSTKEVSEVDALKPKITEQLTYYDYPNERVIILEGENLWFSYKVYLDEKGPHECEFKTHAENTTQYLIEFRADLEESSNLSLSKQVKLALYTHFASPIRQTLNIKMEPRVFPVRQMQLAKHTPSQIIQLAYLCALLEQRHQKSDSKRFTAIAEFLDKAVQVVPVESVFDAITYGKNQIARTCANALQERRLQLQPSQHMIIGALKASIRAHTGYDGAVIDRFIIPSVKTYQQPTHTALWWLQSTQLQGPQMFFPAIGIAQVVVESTHKGMKPKGTMKPKPPTSLRTTNDRRIKRSSQRSSKTYSDAAKSSPSQSTKLMAMPFSIPIFLNSHLNQSPDPFPEYITRYVDECLKGLIRHSHTAMSIQCGAEMRVVTKMNVGELYSALGGKSAHFKSPLQILREGITKLGTYTEGHLLPATKLPNEQMLALIEGIFQKDVSLCALLLGAFMEQQIHIPLIHSAKTTAETLSSQTAPVAVGVWALFSQNLASLEAKLKGHNRSQLIVDIREYMEGFSQKMLDDEDKMYAGKLQFLLHGIQRIVTASSQYISYSLEHQLCSNPKFDKSLTLKYLITEWDTIFQNDALSLIGESHRPLVARWLKWTILVHDLRETLAQYTCIGVTGFVNSGKSLLVRKLFKIQEVKVGIQAAKRTTVPLLYSLEDSVEGLDVIDFPGVDDTDHTIPDLARLLLSLAQIIIFVVDFKRACSDPVKAWLQALSNNGAPIHICLTHADELYAECKAEGKTTKYRRRAEAHPFSLKT